MSDGRPLMTTPDPTRGNVQNQRFTTAYNPQANWTHGHPYPNVGYGPYTFSMQQGSVPMNQYSDILPLTEVLKLLPMFDKPDGKFSWTQWRYKAEELKRDHELTEKAFRTLLNSRVQGRAALAVEKASASSLVPLSSEAILQTLEKELVGGESSREVAEDSLERMKQWQLETAKEYGQRVEMVALRAYPSDRSARYIATKRRIKKGLNDPGMVSRYIDFMKRNPEASISEILEELNEHDPAAREKMVREANMRDGKSEEDPVLPIPSNVVQAYQVLRDTLDQYTTSIHTTSDGFGTKEGDDRKTRGNEFPRGQSKFEPRNKGDNQFQSRSRSPSPASGRVTAATDLDRLVKLVDKALSDLASYREKNDNRLNEQQEQTRILQNWIKKVAATPAPSSVPKSVPSRDSRGNPPWRRDNQNKAGNGANGVIGQREAQGQCHNCGRVGHYRYRCPDKLKVHFCDSCSRDLPEAVRLMYREEGCLYCKNEVSNNSQFLTVYHANKAQSQDTPRSGN